MAPRQPVHAVLAAPTPSRTGVPSRTESGDPVPVPVVIHDRCATGGGTNVPPGSEPHRDTARPSDLFEEQAMKAAVVRTFGEPAHVEDREVPEPGPGQVLVRLEACGLCHTDIHAMHGDWPVKPPLPLVPGHEGVGIIEQLGAGVFSRTVGQRVAMPWLGHACGECRFCIDGRENLCEQQYNNGYGVDGGYAEFMLADARFAVPVPDGITPLDAAPLTCAGVTTY